MKLTLVVYETEPHLTGTIRELPWIVVHGSTIEAVRDEVYQVLSLYLEGIEDQPLSGQEQADGFPERIFHEETIII